MSFASAQPLAPWRWLGVPALLSIGVVIALTIPISIWGVRIPEPVAPLVLAFAWPVIRPSVLAPFALVLLGLFLDLYWGGLMGLWGLSLLIGYGFCLLFRGFVINQGRVVNFGWYAAACGIALVCGVLLTLAVRGHSPNLFAVLWQYLATLILYPFADALIQRFEDADVRFR